MLRILSYVITFVAGGIITLVLHCALILAKEADENIETQNKKTNK